ncbi:MAG: KH domain-containing protein [Nanoarchaeota archaeon]
MARDNYQEKFDETEEKESSMPVQQEGFDETISKKRKVVIPGEVIVSGEDFLPSDGTKRSGDDIVAMRYGLSEESGMVVKVLPITGAFIPRRNNVVIGRVSNITMNGWVVDIDWANPAFLPIDESPRFINKNEMDQFLAVGDILIAKIWGMNQRGIDLSLRSRGLGKLEGGFMFRVIPARVPRIIGKEGSMISLIKDKTGANIVVGQNGWVWINAETADSAIKARKVIEFIVDNFHQEGLTDKVEDFLAK